MKEPQKGRGEEHMRRRRIVARFEIEDRVDSWIQEIKGVIENSERHMEEIDEEEWGGAWDD
eukprot:8634623-Karenia_brevis.AAC.1